MNESGDTYLSTFIEFSQLTMGWSRELKDISFSLRQINDEIQNINDELKVVLGEPIDSEEVSKVKKEIFDLEAEVYMTSKEILELKFEIRKQEMNFTKFKKFEERVNSMDLAFDFTENMINLFNTITDYFETFSERIDPFDSLINEYESSSLLLKSFIMNVEKNK